MNNLKYINLIIGDISNNFNDILSKIIKSPNLKTLILKLHSNNFNINNIIDLLNLIENSKKLRIINITQNKNDKYDINLKTILKQFPKLEKRKYYFDEFIIGNEILVLKKYPIIIYEIRKDLLGKKINLLGNENEEIIKTSKLFLNNKKIKSINHEFSNEGIYKLKVILKESLFNMRNLFYNCCSLTSLNLSNFNINNVYDMSHMFDNCYSLHYLNLSNFITNDVKNMSNMFDNCRSLTSLNLNNFNKIIE
jgi:surface protein